MSSWDYILGFSLHYGAGSMMTGDKFLNEYPILNLKYLSILIKIGLWIIFWLNDTDFCENIHRGTAYNSKGQIKKPKYKN